MKPNLKNNRKVLLGLIFLMATTAEIFSQTEPQIPTDNRLISHADTVVHNAVLPFFEVRSRVGLSMAICDKGKITYYNYGSVQKEKTELPTNNTIYEIGSITKTFCGVLLARAVTENKVKLNDDILLYLDEEYPYLAYKGSPVKLYQLLNHSSGLPFDFIDRKKYKNMNADSVIYILADIASNYTRTQFFNDLHRVKIDTIPGIKLSYSNVAAQLLGFILEKVYKQPYPDLISNYITFPLKMSATAFQLSNNRMKKKKATGYNENGLPMPHFNDGAAGGLYSTTRDLLTYGKMHLNENNPVIKLTHEPTWGQIQYYAMGLNWQMQQKNEGYRRIWQSGSTVGFTSLLCVYPDLDIVMVFLTNEHDYNSEGALSSIEQNILKELIEK